MRILLTLFLSFGSAAFGQAQPAQTAPAQGPPPTNLTRRADGHVTANSDAVNVENFQVHVVQAGDTLSEIAGQFLSDWRLWPQLWEQNDHIVNPHWIYPNDKILIRPVTLITDAAPPALPAAAPPQASGRTVLRLAPPPAPAPAAADLFELTPPRFVSEVKTSDLYCSGFVRREAVADDLKVIGRLNSDNGALAAEADYIYLGRGSDEGVQVADMYQVIRPTREIDNPARPAQDRNLGMHYLEIAQIRVVIAQPTFALARVVHSCEAVEIGDFMVRFQTINLPPIPRPRAFSPFMTSSGQIPGAVVTTKNVLINFGSVFKGSGTTPGARQGALELLERGIASEGAVLYIDVGQKQGVRPGDLFIIYRQMALNEDLYKLPIDARRLEGHRIAIGELVVLKVEELASTALVTYSTDGVSLGDAVERR